MRFDWNRATLAKISEKLSAMRTASYFAERAKRADIPRAIELLNRAGEGNPPIRGDELLR